MRSSCPEPKRSGGVTVKPVQSTRARVVRHSTSLMSQTSHCYIYTLRREYSGLERASAVQLWTENVFLCQMEGRLWPTESPVWTSSNWTFPEPSPLSSSSRRYFICEQRFNGVNQIGSMNPSIDVLSWCVIQLQHSIALLLYDVWKLRISRNECCKNLSDNINI